MQIKNNATAIARQLGSPGQIPADARRYLVELATMTSEMASSVDPRVIRLGAEVLARQAAQLSVLVGGSR